MLEGLVEEWRGVQGELEGVAEGVFGVQWAGTLEGVEGGRLAEVLVKQGDGEGGGEGEAGMDKECKAFEELIKSTGEKAVEKMVESEKVCFPVLGSWGAWGCGVDAYQWDRNSNLSRVRGLSIC